MLSGATSTTRRAATRIMVLHGHARLTVDVDLMVDLDEEPAAKAIDILVGIGLQPRVPVDR